MACCVCNLTAVMCAQASKTLPSKAMSGQTQYDLEIAQGPEGPVYTVNVGKKRLVSRTCAATAWRAVAPEKDAGTDAADARCLHRAFGLASVAVMSELLVRFSVCVAR